MAYKSSTSLLRIDCDTRGADLVFTRELSLFLAAIDAQASPQEASTLQPAVGLQVQAGLAQPIPAGPSHGMAASTSSVVNLDIPSITGQDPDPTACSVQPKAIVDVISKGPALLVQALQAELYSTTKVIMAALKSDNWQNLRDVPSSTPALDVVQRVHVLQLVHQRLASSGLPDEARALCLQLQGWVQAMHTPDRSDVRGSHVL